MMPRGFSLVEVMVGFFLSTFLVLLLMQHVLHVKQQSRVVYTMMHEHAEQHWLLALFQSRIRMAGFTPCLRLDHLIRVDAREKPESMDVMTWSPSSSPHFTVRRMSEVFDVVRLSAASQTFWVETHALHKGQSVLIADCYHAEVHDIAHVMLRAQGALITLKEPLVFDYFSPAYVGEWVSESFFMHARQDGKQTLHYAQHHVDEIAPHVIQFNVELLQQSSTLHAHLTFETDEHRTYVAHVLVRAS